MFWGLHVSFCSQVTDSRSVWDSVWKGLKALKKTPATFRGTNRQTVAVLSCYRKRNKWVQNGNKSPFNSVTLLALGCCTRRLSRKKEKIKNKKQSAQKNRRFHSTAGKPESGRVEGQTGSSRTRKCPDLHSDEVTTKISTYSEKSFKSWQRNCSWPTSAQSILKERRSRWGRAEERPRNTTSGPRMSPSLQGSTGPEFHISSDTESKPLTSHQTHQWSCRYTLVFLSSGRPGSRRVRQWAWWPNQRRKPPAPSKDWNPAAEPRTSGSTQEPAGSPAGNRR